MAFYSDREKNRNGEIPDSYIAGATRYNIHAAKLPSNFEPEVYLYEKLKTASVSEIFRSEFNVEEDAFRSIIEKLEVAAENDHHNIPYIIAQEINDNEDYVVKRLAQIIVEKFPDDFSRIITKIQELTNAPTA